MVGERSTGAELHTVRAAGLSRGRLKGAVVRRDIVAVAAVPRPCDGGAHRDRRECRIEKVVANADLVCRASAATTTAATAAATRVVRRRAAATAGDDGENCGNDQKTYIAHAASRRGNV